MRHAISHRFPRGRRVDPALGSGESRNAVAAPQQGAGSLAPNDVDWPGYDRPYAGDRCSPLRQIPTADVARLRPVWTVDATEHLAVQTAPLVGDGPLDCTTDTNTDTSTYAIDAATCALRWTQRTPMPQLGGGVITVRGRQRIAAAAGMNGLTRPVQAQSARIVVYGLP